MQHLPAGGTVGGLSSDRSSSALTQDRDTQRSTRNYVKETDRSFIPKDAVRCQDYTASVIETWGTSQENKTNKRNRSTPRKTCPSELFPPQIRRTDLRSKPSLHGDRQATSLLRYGTTCTLHGTWHYPIHSSRRHIFWQSARNKLGMDKSGAMIT